MIYFSIDIILPTHPPVHTHTDMSGVFSRWGYTTTNGLLANNQFNSIIALITIVVNIVMTLIIYLPIDQPGKVQDVLKEFENIVCE